MKQPDIRVNLSFDPESENTPVELCLGPANDTLKKISCKESQSKISCKESQSKVPDPEAAEILENQPPVEVISCGSLKVPANGEIFKRSSPRVNKEVLVPSNPCPIHSTYIVKEKIGQGAWGSVHLAMERASGLERAVKKIPKRFTNELFRFRQEIVFLKSIDHPNIVRLYETYEDYANLYLVMEVCRGGELFDRVTNSSYFSEVSAARLLQQILSSVCYLHRKNIAHRDLKPENFLFLSKADSSPMKLIDFGLAKRFNSKRKLRTRVGTLYYVPPQVLEGYYDEKCDVWSAGVILHLLLSGTPPFNGPNDAVIIQQIREGQLRFSSKIWDKVSTIAKDLVQCLLQSDPSKRPSASEALEHPWFRMLLPVAFPKFPRPNSMPGGMQTFCRDSTLEFKSSAFSCSPYGNSFPATTLIDFQQAGRSDTRPFIGFTPVQCPEGHFVQYSEESKVEIKDSEPVSRLNSELNIDLEEFRMWTNLAKRLLPNWRRFAVQNQLKRAVLRVIAQQLSDGEELQPLRSLFLALDLNHTGALSGDDISTGLDFLSRSSEKIASNDTETGTVISTCDNSPESLEALNKSGSTKQSSESVHNFHEGDDREESLASVADCQKLVSEITLDGGNSLEYSDFLAASIDHKQYMRDCVLKAAYRLFDRDGDGTIVSSDLRAALGWCDFFDPCANYSRQGESELTKSLIDEEIKYILKVWDRDEDGAIGYNDFVKVIAEDQTESLLN